MPGWNPWAALRDRPHLEFALVDLPNDLGGAFYSPQGDWAALLVDRALPRRRRRAVVAHELIHDERGGGCVGVGMPPTWAAVVARDEITVEREVARRLVPLEDLVDFIEQLAAAEEVGVTVWEVAEAFDVPDYVAERALRELGRRNPDGWEST